MEIASGVEVNERICFGKPVIKGTRVPVELILGKLAGGMGFEQVMREYEITLEDILAALDYASKVVGQEQIKVY
ncbi:MAG TPA: hypothetical protein DCY61_02365 [Dehalococcoidia bacterium]|nr:hypothetical protein [Dehalococcoidia bacterium]